MFSPQTDFLPAHPSWQSFDKHPLYTKSLMDMGMKYIHVSSHMPLHMAELQIKRNEV